MEIQICLWLIEHVASFLWRVSSSIHYFSSCCLQTRRSRHKRNESFLGNCLLNDDCYADESRDEALKDRFVNHGDSLPTYIYYVEIPCHSHPLKPPTPRTQERLVSGPTLVGPMLDLKCDEYD